MVSILICALVIETAGLIILISRAARLARDVERLRRRCENRLTALEQEVAALLGEDDSMPETRADDRKRAREAERRFTEGVANILSFSCNIAGRKGEGL